LDSHPNHIREVVNAMLKRLRTDRIAQPASAMKSHRLAKLAFT
jgi:hypothetical protein